MKKRSVMNAISLAACDNYFPAFKGQLKIFVFFNSLTSFLCTMPLPAFRSSALLRYCTFALVLYCRRFCGVLA